MQNKLQWTNLEEIGNKKSNTHKNAEQTAKPGINNPVEKKQYCRAVCASCIGAN
jgi:predicted transcriptional regulator